MILKVMNGNRSCKKKSEFSLKKPPFFFKDPARTSSVSIKSTPSHILYFSQPEYLKPWGCRRAVSVNGIQTWVFFSRFFTSLSFCISSRFSYFHFIFILRNDNNYFLSKFSLFAFQLGCCCLFFCSLFKFWNKWLKENKFDYKIHT